MAHSSQKTFELLLIIKGILLHIYIIFDIDQNVARMPKYILRLENIVFVSCPFWTNILLHQNFETYNETFVQELLPETQNITLGSDQKPTNTNMSKIIWIFDKENI